MSSSSYSSTSYTSGELAEVTTGGLVVEKGSSLAFEFARKDPCTCLCAPFEITALLLRDCDGLTVAGGTYDPVESSADWLGKLNLCKSGGEDLPLGCYTAETEASIGRFNVGLEIAEKQRFARLGMYSASASVCGISLLTYRLITEQDDGAMVHLRQGDLLMVDLVGNATTGYEWANTILYEYSILRETEPTEYRPAPHPDQMVGYGGQFVFRYRAIAPGAQAFRFVYSRPWEDEQPEKTLEFTAIVH